MQMCASLCSSIAQSSHPTRSIPWLWQMRARFRCKRTGTFVATDHEYAACLALCSTPVPAFLGEVPAPNRILPVSSISEDRLLDALGLSKVVQAQILGLQSGLSSNSVVVRGGTILSEAQLAAVALMR